MDKPIIETSKLNFYYGSFHALIDVNLKVGRNKITSLIGPSGCGKSTLLRIFNRMNDLIDGTTTSGSVLIEGREILGPQVDLVDLRKHVGMVFQRPNPFPLSVFENVAFGLRIRGERRKNVLEEAVCKSLSSVLLFDDLKDKLSLNALQLTLEQQQRLCIARLIAVTPDLLLMDEICSALDPMATMKIESLMLELKKQYTIVIVTHNMQQASRVSDYTGYMLLGEMIEFNETKNIFTNPSKKLTEDYISGKYG